MRVFLTIFLIISLACTVQAKKIKLFNGKNFKGWELVVKDNAAPVDDVFTVEDGVIKVCGEPQGYIRTEEVYTNYKLHVEWRWTEKPTNSGVLLHVNGYDHWPNCIEAQLKSGNAGDIVLIGYGTTGAVKDSTYINAHERYTVIDKYKASSEKPAGEWNSYDITCNRDNMVLYVNGILQNEGSKLSHTGGSIALQSEGSPIEFRNIFLEKIRE